MDFRTELSQLLKAQFSLIYVETYEERRAIEVITEVASSPLWVKTPRQVLTWSSTDGLTGKDEVSNPNTRQAIDALNQALTSDGPSVLIFRDLHSSLGDTTRPADSQVVRRLKDISLEFKSGSAPRTLIILAPVMRLPVELEKEITILEFPLPDEAELRALLDEVIATNVNEGRIVVSVDEMGLERLAKAALGLTLSEADNAFARAMVDDGKITDLDIEIVQDEKRQTIRKSGTLDFIPPSATLDEIGGLENLKSWLLKRNNAWLDNARAFGLPSPRGVLITGVPGCGKSLTAKAMASAWQLPLLRLDVGRIFAGLVGSSEQNMRSVLRTAEAIAPCVLWIDEIEKGFSNTSGQGDSGTSARVFGTFLTWMQEKTSSVFVVATANNIDSLPPEFLRKGRFDEIFFVDLPTSEEREIIWSVHMKKLMVGELHTTSVKPDQDVLTRLSASTSEFSGAEIEQAVIAGMFDAFYGKRAVSEEDFLRAVSNTVPLSVTQSEEIEALRQWANVRAVAASAPSQVDQGIVQDVEAATLTGSVKKSQRGGRRIDI